MKEGGITVYYVSNTKEPVQETSTFIKLTEVKQYRSLSEQKFKIKLRKVDFLRYKTSLYYYSVNIVFLTVDSLTTTTTYIPVLPLGPPFPLSPRGPLFPLPPGGPQRPGGPPRPGRHSRKEKETDR